MLTRESWVIEQRLQCAYKHQDEVPLLSGLSNSSHQAHFLNMNGDSYRLKEIKGEM